MAVMDFQGDWINQAYAVGDVVRDGDVPANQVRLYYCYTVPVADANGQHLHPSSPGAVAYWLPLTVGDTNPKRSGL